MHPDVKKGIKTEEEVLSEFLDTFEVHHGLKHPEDRDGKVTLREFIEYYTNISSTIDNDEYFELMITNAWNLNNFNYGKAWGGEIWNKAYFFALLKSFFPIGPLTAVTVHFLYNIPA